jgi:hypothetical protein
MYGCVPQQREVNTPNVRLSGLICKGCQWRGPWGFVNTSLPTTPVEGDVCGYDTNRCRSLT